MEHIHYVSDGGVAVLTMARGKANALNAAMLGEMDAALDQAASDAEVRALILSSHSPKFFSGGFDVAEVFQYDRETMRAFLENYGGLAHKLHEFPKPTVACLTGHTYAGGAILALCCDFRVMADGEFGFALNEINVGVVLPPSVFHLLADVVGPGYARRMALTGEAVPPRRALEIGLVDSLAGAEQVREQAMELARSLAGKPAAVYAVIKKNVRRTADAGLLTPDLEPWFTPEAEARKKALFASVKS